MNVDSAFNCGTGMFGVWSSAVTVSGTKTLNIQHYSGSDMASLTHYDTVNVFGGEIPAGFSEKNPAHSMNVYDYSGVLGLTLTDFDAFTASGIFAALPISAAQAMQTAAATSAMPSVSHSQESSCRIFMRSSSPVH